MRFAVAVLVFATLVPGIGCKKPHCLSMKEEFHAGGIRMEWSQCPDELVHLVDCAQRGSDFTCGCVPGSSFDTKLSHKGDAVSGDMTAEAAKEGCKWDILP